MCTWESHVLLCYDPEFCFNSPNSPAPSQRTALGVTGQREQQGPYQVESLVGMLEGQQHVLEDTEGSSPHDGVQQLREDLKRSSRQGSPDLSDPGPSVTTVDPERVETAGQQWEQEHGCVSELDGAIDVEPAARGR